MSEAGGVGDLLTAQSSPWVPPWELLDATVATSVSEMLFLVALLALIMVWAMVESETRLRYWAGLLAVAVAVKLYLDDGPIFHAVSERMLGFESQLVGWFR